MHRTYCPARRPPIQAAGAMRQHGRMTPVGWTGPRQARPGDYDAIAAAERAL